MVLPKSIPLAFFGYNLSCYIFPPFGVSIMFRISILTIAVLFAAVFCAADSAKKPFAFVIGFSGEVSVESDKANLGMAVYEGDLVKVGTKSSASVLLIDDSLYKVGAGKNVKIASSLVKGDVKTYPKKDGTWVILYKKFQDRVKAQNDLSQYGAVRKSGFDADMSYLSKAEVKSLADSAASKLELTPKHADYYYVTGSVWEYHSYYIEAQKIYSEGISMFPMSRDLLFALSVVKAKLEGQR